MTDQETLALELLSRHPRDLTVGMAMEAAAKIIEDRANG